MACCRAVRTLQKGLDQVPGGLNVASISPRVFQMLTGFGSELQTTGSILQGFYRKTVILSQINITTRTKPEINAVKKPLLVYLL